MTDFDSVPVNEGLFIREAVVHQPQEFYSNVCFLTDFSNFWLGWVYQPAGQVFAKRVLVILQGCKYLPGCGGLDWAAPFHSHFACSYL